MMQSFPLIPLSQSTSLFELDLAPYLNELPEGQLTYSTLTTRPDVANSQIVQDESIRLLVIPKKTGNTRVLIQVNNESGEGIATGFSIVINASPSVIQTLPNRYVTQDTPPFSIDPLPLFSSPDNTPLSYSFATSNPSLASLDVQPDTTILISLGNNATPGERTTIEITARDPQGGEASLSFDLIIDVPPVITPPRLPEPGSIPEQSTHLLETPIIDHSGLKSVQINFRVGGDRQFILADMARNPQFADSYGYEFPEAFITNEGLEYFITATDSVDLQTRYPETDFISIPVSLANGVTKNTIQPIGTTQTAYRLISFPIDLDADKRNAREIMENIYGNYDDVEWRFFSLENTQLYQELGRGTEP